MASVAETQRSQTPADDPWRLGWRYVNHKEADGSVRVETVPLTPRDVLFPQVDDFIVQTSAHWDDCRYLSTVFDAQLHDDPRAVELADCRVDCNVPDLEPLGPDIAVMQDCRRKHNDWSTFDVAEEGARPVLFVEITSPNTKENDLGVKREYYFQAGVAVYVIADADERTDRPRTVRLIGLRWTPDGYVDLPPDGRGWLWLEAVRVWLGVVRDAQLGYDRLACFDVDGREIGDYSKVVADLRAERAARQAAEARTASAVAEREAEASARQAAEARTASAVAEREAEARARQVAETRARQSTEAQQAMEQRLRELEEENQRLRGPRLGAGGPQ